MLFGEIGLAEVTAPAFIGVGDARQGHPRLVLRKVASRSQVGPGECAEALPGQTACFHPNAVYLNGNGEELDAADGTSGRSVKHSWLVDGESCEPMPPKEEYDQCFWIECELLEDGLSMKLGGTGEHQPWYDVRTPQLDESPITYTVTRDAATHADPAAGEIDLTPTVQFALTGPVNLLTVWDHATRLSRGFDQGAHRGHPLGGTDSPPCVNVVSLTPGPTGGRGACLGRGCGAACAAASLEGFLPLGLRCAMWVTATRVEQGPRRRRERAVVRVDPTVRRGTKDRAKRGHPPGGTDGGGMEPPSAADPSSCAGCRPARRCPLQSTDHRI